MGARERRRGKVGEREVAKMLRAAGWRGARRGQQFRGGGDSPDVVDGPTGFHLEVKFVEALNWWAAFRQAQREAKPTEVPLVLARRNHAPWLALLPAEELLRLIRDAHTYREQLTREMLR